MAHSPRPANSLAVIIWSRPRISTPHLRLPPGFPAPRSARSKSGRSWFIAKPEMTSGDIEAIFRNEAGRALATLIRLVGDFDLAEDALQDAFATALERWPAADPPSN